MELYFLLRSEMHVVITLFWSLDTCLGCCQGVRLGFWSFCNEGDLGSIPGLGRSPGEGNGNPLQSSCLENLMDGGAWWAIVHGIFQARGLEWVAISFSRGSSWPRDWTCASYVSFISTQILYHRATNGIFTIIIIPLAGTKNCVDGIGLFNYDLSVPCYSLY